MTTKSDQWEELIKEGCKIIPKSMHQEWSCFVNKYQAMPEKDSLKHLEICTEISYFLQKFLDSSGKIIAQDFFERYNYKNNYAKVLADHIASFAPYPKNTHFLQGYYECFVDITTQEESALTDKISELKRINELIKTGLTYDEAQIINKTQIFNLDLNGQNITVIEYVDQLYYGINDDDELVFYKPIKDNFDVLYLIREDGYYNRLIARHHTLTSRGMLPDKILVTDANNNILSVDNYEILKNPHLTDLESMAHYYKKVEEKVKSTDIKTILSILKELSDLSNNLDTENHTICEAIFDKMTSEFNNKKPNEK